MDAPTYSIVLPAYNERERIAATLDKILAYAQRRGWNAEVIVVNDGSTDDTTKIVAEYARRNDGLRLLENPGNRGKGYAVKQGMLEAQGEWILFTDADLSTPIEEVKTLYGHLRKDKAVIAIGSRAIEPSLVQIHQAVLREWSGKFFNFVMRRLTGLEFQDTQCGFKLYQFQAAQKVFTRQQLDGFCFDVEDLFIARCVALKTIEVPVRWSNVPGTKVGMLGGLKSFADLFRIRWNVAKGRYK